MPQARMCSQGTNLDPDRALQLLEQYARAEQAALASRSDVGEDVLHYLSQNGAVATRRAVAANPSASPVSNRLLANDTEDEVRTELARKIGRLFPGLMLIEQKQLRDLTVETLETLARDEEPLVRAALAEEIKHLDCVPRGVVKQLARDLEEIVAAPILEYSPLLNDSDLIEIVAAAQTNAMLAAVARRKGLSETVSDVVVSKGDTSVIAALLANIDARIRKKTLDRIVTQAAEVAEWQGPLVLRAELSPRMIRRLAGFVAGALIEALSRRSGLDDQTCAHLRKRLAERHQSEAKAGDKPDAADMVETARLAGKLDDGFVAAAAEACQKDTVVRALSVLAKVDEALARRILDSGSAKAVTALAWKAGLSMRIAFKLQTGILRLKGSELLPARGGTDYPMGEQEMRWHLGVFGIA